MLCFFVFFSLIHQLELEKKMGEGARPEDKVEMTRLSREETSGAPSF